MSSPILIKTVNGTIVGHIDGKPLAQILNGPEPFIELTRSRIVERVEDVEQLADAPEYGSIQVNKANIVAALEL